MKVVEKFFVQSDDICKLQKLKKNNQFFILGILAFVALSLFVEKLLIG